MGHVAFWGRDPIKGNTLHFKNNMSKRDGLKFLRIIKG